MEVVSQGAYVEWWRQGRQMAEAMDREAEELVGRARHLRVMARRIRRVVQEEIRPGRPRGDGRLPAPAKAEVREGAGG